MSTDITKRYLFHNIYGDATELINTKPDDVILVPFGWSPDIENTRNFLLQELNLTGVSCLPSLIFWCPARTITVFNQNGSSVVNIPEKWEEVAVGYLPQPWTWQQINAQQALIAQSS